ncbi:MAG: limonene-1,2-epoxide hydrolase family protein [Sphingomonadaceae bacterium]
MSEPEHSVNLVAVVRAFCEAWQEPDMLAILSMLSSDILYCNGPLPPLSGKQQVTRYLRQAGPFEKVKWDVLHIACTGDTVLTERVDIIVKNGRTISLPIMGAFQVKNGLIREWRDYFDLDSYRKQQTGEEQQE